MKTSVRLLAPIVGLLLVASACSDGDGPAVEDASAEGADADDSHDAADEPAEAGDDEAGDDGAGDSDGDDEAAADEGGAEGTWQGEPIAFTGASCGTLPMPDVYEVRGRIDGGGHLQARFEVDLEADGDDITLVSDTPTRLELFFPGEGGTIGDGEGFRAASEDLASLDASASHVSGTVALEPDSSTMADETTPDGGTVEFAIECPA